MGPLAGSLEGESGGEKVGRRTGHTDVASVPPQRMALNAVPGAFPVAVDARPQWSASQHVTWPSHRALIWKVSSLLLRALCLGILTTSEQGTPGFFQPALDPADPVTLLPGALIFYQRRKDGLDWAQGP